MKAAAKIAGHWRFLAALINMMLNLLNIIFNSRKSRKIDGVSAKINTGSYKPELSKILSFALSFPQGYQLDSCI